MNDGFCAGEVSKDRCVGLDNVHDVQPRYMNIDGHELDLGDSTNKSAVAEREGGEKKEKTYDSSGLSGAFLSYEE